MVILFQKDIDPSYIVYNKINNAIMKRLFVQLTILMVCVSFSSCKDFFKPSYIEEEPPKLFAACAGDHEFISKLIYELAEDAYKEEIERDNSDSNVVKRKKQLDNCKVFLSGKDCFGNPITANDLYNFIRHEELPEQNISSLGDVEDAIASLFACAMVGNLKASKKEAFESVQELVSLSTIEYEICKRVELFDYRKSENSSIDNAKAYDVVYKINRGHGSSNDCIYVWCYVLELNDEYEIEYVSDSEFVSDLGY